MSDANTDQEQNPANDAAASIPENGRKNTIDISNVAAEETLIVSIDGQSNLNLDFDLENVDIEFADVDMILRFENGGKIVIEGFGLEAMSERPPELQFISQRLVADDVMELVGRIERGGSEARTGFRSKMQDPNTDAQRSDEHNDKTDDGPNTVQSTEPQEPVVIIETAAPTFSATPVSPVQSIEKSGSSKFEGRFKVRPTDPTDDAPPPPTQTNPSSGSPVKPSGTFDGLPGPRVAADLDATLLGVTGIKTDDRGANTEKTGAAAAEGADENPSYAVQSASEVINGTTGSDHIIADNPDNTPSGKAVRLVEIAVAPQSGSWEPSEIRIRGLPKGVTILNAENKGNYFKLGADAISEDNKFQFILQYDLPKDGDAVDANGFFQTFNITFDVGLTDSVTKKSGQTSGSLQFAVRNVQNESDASHNDPVTNKPVHVLNAVPPGNDINARAGDDSIVAGAGADRIDGGAGNDSVLYSQSDEAVNVDLKAGTASGGYAEGDQLTSIESVAGSNHDDTLTGNDGANTLVGGAGDDLLDGGAGADTIKGGSGTDTVTYANSSGGVTVGLDGRVGLGGDAAGDVLSSVERVIGSDHDDRMTGTDGDEQFEGGLGDDTFLGLGGADTIDGGLGTDTVDYSRSNSAVTVNLDGTRSSGGGAEGDVLSSIERVVGSQHNDTINGTAAAEYLYGGGGDDLLKGGAGADKLVGGDGNDTADYTQSNAGVTIDLVAGTGVGGTAEGDTLASIETILGSSHDDQLRGSYQDETFDGGAGADAIDGRAGTDTVTYARSQSGVQISLDGTSGTGGDAQGDTLTDVENLVGSAHGDRLTGTDRDESFDGGDGDDVIDAGDGADAIDGGDGLDTVDYQRSSERVIVDLSRITQSGGDAEGDRLTNIEAVIGSAHDDIITGDDEANTLRGAGGDDTLKGGVGADHLDGGSGKDTADYRGSDAGVDVDLTAGTGSGGHAEGDTLSEIEDVQGSDHGDRLQGSVDANSLYGHDGDDWLSGGLGADQLIGGAGSDTADYTNSYTGVSVSLTDGTGTGGEAEGDTLSGIENLTGSANDDTLVGDDQNNRLTGGGGSDTLKGLGGADHLDGGAGFDTADYSDSTFGVSVNFDGSTGSGGDADGDTLHSIERVIGSALDDSFLGSINAETAEGGDGDDRFEMGLGADTIDGGDGFDTAAYTNSTSRVIVNLETGTASGGEAQGDRLSNIERVVGSQFNDILTANNLGSTLDGGAGNDTFHAGNGTDTIIGGDGIDHLHYTNSTEGVTVDLTGNASSGGSAEGDIVTGVEQVTGSDHNDTLIGNDDDNSLYGGNGDDVLRGGAGADYLHGGAGVDTVDYSTSNDGVSINLYYGTATGGDANGDTMYSIENITGSDHNDRLIGNSANNVIRGGDGDDWINGGSGTDRIYTGAGTNTVFGGNGWDHIYAGSGADKIDGGRNFDTVYYRDSTSAVTVDRSTGTGTGGFAEGDTYVGVERFFLSDHDDTFIGHSTSRYNTASGGDGDDTFYGGNLADRYSGDDGDDYFYGSGGADNLHGGTGFDTIDYSGSAEAVQVTLSASGRQTGGGDAAGDYLVSFEAVIGSAHDDTLASDFTATFTGGGGNDAITGSGLVDTARFDGDFADFSVVRTGANEVTITDLRTGSPVGTDTIARVERFVFNDGERKFSEILANEGPSSLFLTSGDLNPAHSEDFESGAAGWSNAKTTSGSGSISKFLGMFDGGGTSSSEQQIGKTFALSGDQSQIKISFDFLQIDRWAGEEFAVYVNGEAVSIDNFHMLHDGVVEGSGSAQSLIGKGDLGVGGRGKWYHDQVWRYELVVDVAGSDVEIGFGAGIKGSSSNWHQKLWGIDNFSIAENVSTQNLTVAEFAANGAHVATAQGWDSEGHKSVTFSLLDDAGGRFAIDPTTGKITIADAGNINYASSQSHNITVRVTDEDNATLDRTFTIDVTATNRPPTDIILLDNSIDEDAALHDIVGTARGVDPDGGETLTYSLLDDADGRFAINAATGEISIADPSKINFEDATSHTITAQVRDSANNVYSKTLTINIKDVNEAPDSIALSNDTIAENSVNGTVVGQATGADQDAGETLRYSLLDNAGGRFAIDPATGEITVADASLLNFEDNTSHSIQIRVTDSANNSVDRTVTINVTDVNETPTDLSITTSDVDENSANGTAIGTVSAADSDSGETFTYSLVDDADGRFAIDSVTGAVTVADQSALDHEANSSHTITVRVVDSSNNSFEKQISITVNDINEAPTDASLSADTVAENAANSSVVGTVLVADDDASDSHSFVLTDDAGGRFAIDAATGIITVKDTGSIDYETASSHTVTVQITDSNSAQITKTFTINVADQNETATDLSLSGSGINEDAVSGTVVGSVSVTDPDAGDSFSYALTDDADGRFAIDPTTGAVTVANPAGLDFETASSHNITIQVTDAGNNKFSKTIAITVGDVNDAPENIALSSSVIDEHATAGSVVGTVSADDFDAGDSVTFALTGDAGGRFEIDSASGQIRVKAGATFDHETNPSHEIEVEVKDSNGASTKKIFTVTVDDRNETPTDIALSGDAIAEDVTNGAVVGSVSTSDPDSGDNFTYELTDDAGGRFAINRLTGEITVADASLIDFEGASSHVIEVRSTDSGDLSVTKSFTINVTDAGDAPTDLSLSAANVAENAALGAVIGTVSTTDVDSGDSFTYSLTDDAGGRFVIDPSTGVITLADPSTLDHEGAGSHEVTVKSTDSTNNHVSKTFTINVTDVNERPTDMALSANTIAEGATLGAAIGTVSTTDADSGDSFTYRLVDDAGGRFAIDPSTGVITLADPSKLDFETATSHQLTVEVTDSGNLTHQKSFTVNLTNTNEAPTDLALSHDTIVENSADGTLVGTVLPTDPDAGESYTFGLTNDAGGRFTIDPATGRITVADGSLLDHESATSHNIEVQVTDSGNNSYSKSLTINLTNEANESFTATSNAESFTDSAGTDSVSYANSNAGVTIANDGSAGSGGFAAGDTLNGIDRITGSNYADQITGTSAAEVILGGGGADQITGGGGADTLDGGLGDDVFIMAEDEFEAVGLTIDGGAGTDTVQIENAASGDLSAMFGVMSNIEVIDFTQAGVNANVNLGLSDIQAVTDSNNDLTLRYDSGDTIDFDTDNAFVQANDDNSVFIFYEDDSYQTEIARVNLIAS